MHRAQHWQTRRVHVVHAFGSAPVPDDHSVKVPLYTLPHHTSATTQWCPRPSSPRNVADAVLPKDDPSTISPRAVANTLRQGLKLCAAYRTERGGRIKRSRNEIPDTSSGRRSRTRRDAVWNDALRGLALQGPPLRICATALCTISESVDAVCQIDEGLLIRQQTSGANNVNVLQTVRTRADAASAQRLCCRHSREWIDTRNCTRWGHKFAQSGVKRIAQAGVELAGGSSGNGGGFFAIQFDPKTS